MFGSRMTPAQLAKAKGGAQNANALRKLGDAANGFGVTRAERERAQAALEREHGKRKAKQIREDSARSAGARPKGLARWLG